MGEENIVAIEILLVHGSFKVRVARILHNGLRPDIAGLTGIKLRCGVADDHEACGVLQLLALLDAVHLLNDAGKLGLRRDPATKGKKPNKVERLSVHKLDISGSSRIKKPRW